MIPQAKAWREVSLGEICEFKYGKSLPEGKRTGGDIPVYGSNGVVGWHNEAISDGKTIIIGRKGSFGEVNFTSVSCWPIDTTYYIDNSATEVDLKWLAYILPSLGLTRLNRAAAIPGLNREDAYRQRLLLPLLEEQKRIADILDRAEALRAKRRAALVQLDEITQSIFIEMFGDPVKNPKNWKLEKVQEVISQIEAGWSANGESRPREENEYAVLKVSAVTQGVFLPEECKVINNNIEFKKVVTPEKGDVLFSRANTLELVGASCLIRENYPYLLLPDKLWKIRVKEEKICPEYFKFVLSYPTIRHEISKRSTGTSGSMYNISMDKFRLIKITVPPIALQCEFALRIEAIEKLKTAHKNSLAELDELFTSFQHRAFRSEL